LENTDVVVVEECGCSCCRVRVVGEKKCEVVYGAEGVFFNT